MEVSIERKVEIEKEFAKILNSGIPRKEALAYIVLKISTIKEAAYMFEAYQMPIEEISKEIKRYDSSHPRLDELKFVSDLCERYDVNRETIVQRIQNVRTIYFYLKLKKMELNPTEKESNKKK